MAGGQVPRYSPHLPSLGQNIQLLRSALLKEGSVHLPAGVALRLFRKPEGALIAAVFECACYRKTQGFGF